MSQEQAQAFIEKMKIDAGFRERIMAKDDPQARLQIIHDEGFDCSAEEIEAVSAELGKTDLDAVAGGGEPWGEADGFGCHPAMNETSSF